MNPYRLKDVFNYLTSNNQLLKRKLKLGTDEIPIPPKRDDVTTIEAINRFNKANPRVDTTNLKPLSVKQSNVKQSNVNEPNEGAIQSAFDTATREAQFEGYPAPSYEKFKARYLKRNMKADGGMLVQPSDDGSRPGYKKDKFTVGSGPGTGDALTSDRNTKIVKTALNKIKKQINNKPYFEWSEKSDWYKKLQSKLGGKAEGVGMNRDFTNQLINKVVNENFPGAYHGRSAISNLRKDMVVNGFVEYLKDNGEFDGGEKFLKSFQTGSCQDQ